MKDIQELQKPIDLAIVNSMIESTPEEWTSITLVLTKESKEKNIGEFIHELSSPEGHAPVSPEMTLYEASHKLDKLLQSNNAIIKKSIYKATYDGDNWSYVAEFEYFE